MSDIKVWELLVPSHQADGSIFSIVHYQIWDRRICELIGGLTLYPSVKGRWGTDTISEHMIPVKLACTEEQLQQVLELTGKHYQQEEVLAWVVSPEVRVWRQT